MGFPILAADQRLSEQNSITERSGIAFLDPIDGQQDKQTGEEKNVIKATIPKDHKGNKGKLSQSGKAATILSNAAVLPPWTRKAC
jgi:hypothetical protein